MTFILKTARFYLNSWYLKLEDTVYAFKILSVPMFLNSCEVRFPLWKNVHTLIKINNDLLQLKHIKAKSLPVLYMSVQT